MKVLTKHQVWMLARTLCFDTEDLLEKVERSPGSTPGLPLFT